MRYINGSGVTRTFHGVEMKPGEIKDVPGNINVPGFYPVAAEPIKQMSETAEAEMEPAKEQVVQAEKQVEVKTTKSKKSKDGEN